MNAMILILAAVQPLWPSLEQMPDRQPHQYAAMCDEAWIPGQWGKFKPDFKIEEHAMPHLDWCEPPAKPNGTCVILISGGGYGSLVDVGFVNNWNRCFTRLGCQCVKLVYRTPRAKGIPFYQTAWEDGQRAVRLVRSQAKARGFDPEKIAAIGCSAGSHLTTLLVTSSQTPAYRPVDALDRDVSCHLNLGITGAIAYGMTDGLDGENTQKGDGPGITLDPLFKFDAKTCPMCMFHGCDDPYSPMTSTHVYRKLHAMKIPAEVHLFADRTHNFWGWNAGSEKATAYDNWFERAHEFMVQVGFLGPVAEEVAIMSRYTNDVAYAYHAKAPVWADRMPDVQTNQCTPQLEWFVPKKLTTKAIQIVYSGGAYVGNNPNGFEAAPVRRFLNEKGMAVVTLKYRTPRPVGLPKHKTAWQDLQRAIRVVRGEALSHGLDPNRIGIIGFSAGGHLTLLGACNSTVRAYEPTDKTDELPCNVQWAIAVYPAYVLTDGAESGNRHGGDRDEDVIVPEFAFDALTAPVCFVHGGADVHSPMGSVKFWERLRRMGVQCDLHTLATRGHTFQKTASPGTGSYTWMGRVWEFLNHKGFNR